MVEGTQTSEQMGAGTQLPVRSLHSIGRGCPRLYNLSTGLREALASDSVPWVFVSVSGSFCDQNHTHKQQEAKDNGQNLSHPLHKQKVITRSRE